MPHKYSFSKAITALTDKTETNKVTIRYDIIIHQMT